MKKISILIILNLFVFLAYCLTQYDFGYRPNTLAQFGSMFLLAGLFVMVIADCISLFIFLKDYHFLAIIIPFAILLLSFKGGSVCFDFGYNQRIKIFTEQLPEYEEVVRLMDDGAENGRTGWAFGEIPAKYRRLTYCVHAEREGNVLRVVFFWGSGFPVKHTAFAYMSNGVPPTKGSRFCHNWPHVIRINDNWFTVGD